MVAPGWVTSDTERGVGKDKNQEGRTLCPSCGGSGRPSLEALTPAASRLSAFLEFSSCPTFFPEASMRKLPPTFEKASWTCHTQPCAGNSAPITVHLSYPFPGLKAPGIHYKSVTYALAPTGAETIEQVRTGKTGQRDLGMGEFQPLPCRNQPTLGAVPGRAKMPILAPCLLYRHPHQDCEATQDTQGSLQPEQDKHLTLP